MELTVRDLTKRYKDKTAVDGVSLRLTEGINGLLGANGAGKTTLMRMIAGIMQPTSGRVVYDGVPIQELGEQYRSIFGFLPQDFGFHPEFTVKDYLAYVAALKGLPERQSWRRIRELLERVSLMDVYNKKISKLSGGMRRRVGIAQALLNDPEVLILDEPTGGLDPGERVRFRNLLSEFAHDRIVLISTHIVSDIEYIATRNAIMKNGAILQVGSTRELVVQMEGRVFEASIDPRDLSRLEEKVQVVNVRNEADGSVSLRYLGAPDDVPQARPQEPRLEDLYLELFPRR